MFTTWGNVRERTSVKGFFWAFLLLLPRARALSQIEQLPQEAKSKSTSKSKTRRGGRGRGEAEEEKISVFGLLDKSMVESHIVGQQEHGSGGEFIGSARIVELPRIGVPMVEVAVFDRQNFAIHSTPTLAA